MDGVGEVHRRCPAGQLHDAAFGREHVDFIREQIHFHVFDELHGVIGPLPHFHQPLHPAVHPRLIHAGHAAGLVLVHPVSRDTVVGDVLHLLRPDLDLDVHMHTEQGGVKRLIAIGLGHGNIVLEPARQRLVQAVNGAKDSVAVIFGVGDNPEGIHIHDFMEGLLLELHLVIDAVQVFFPAQNPARQASLLQLFLQLPADILDNFPMTAPEFVHGLGNVLGAHGVQGGKAQVLKLGADGVHAQAVRDGGIDVECFGGDALALFVGHRAERAHVVQPVRQLHQNDPDVPRHGQGHFLEVFGLGFRPGAKLDLGQFADTIHQFRDVLAKLFRQSVLGNTGVFNHIMEHGRHQTLMIQPQVGENMGNSKGMGNVAVAALAHLPLMGLLGVIVGPSHLVDAIGIKIGAELSSQSFNRSLCRHRASTIP